MGKILYLRAKRRCALLQRKTMRWVGSSLFLRDTVYILCYSDVPISEPSGSRPYCRDMIPENSLYREKQAGKRPKCPSFPNPVSGRENNVCARFI